MVSRPHIGHFGNTSQEFKTLIMASIQEAKDKIRNGIEALGIPDLQNELEANSLATDGNKQELQERLMSYQLEEWKKDNAEHLYERYYDTDTNVQSTISDSTNELLEVMKLCMKSANEERMYIAAERHAVKDERDQTQTLLTLLLENVKKESTNTSSTCPGFVLTPDVIKRKFDRMTLELLELIDVVDEKREE